MRSIWVPIIVSVVLMLSNTMAWAQSYQATITLDPLPSELNAGDTIIFSGELITSDGQYVIPGRTVYIKDDVSFGLDTIIGSIVTDENGYYAGSWVAEVREGGGAYDFYAVFEGEADISDARSQTYSVHVSDSDGQSFPPAQEYYPTMITLDPLPTEVYFGDSLTFTGRLTSDGMPISNAFIKIMEDDPLQSDQILSTGVTTGDGRFSIPWQVSKDTFETNFDIYATFDGDSHYVYARSSNQIVSVLRFSGSISLDPLPSSANVGDLLIFNGYLELSQSSSEGAIVYIKDEDPLSADDLLATAYVNSDGTFSASWLVTEMDADREADIYAVFEGNDHYYRLTTCDPNPTMDYGGTCEFTVPLSIYYQPETPPEPATTYTDDQFMDLFYSLDLNSGPSIAIVPNPDSYTLAYKYVGATQEGILMWTSLMQERYDGVWNVEFEVIDEGQLFFSSEPDIVVNLVTPEQESGCIRDFAGVAYIRAQPIKPVQTKVCVVAGDSVRSTSDVAATAAHEFIHAMGLGHTWNVQGDLMCSNEEDDSGTKVWTCPNNWLGNSKTPSELNLAAVAALYGTDGFEKPNAQVAYKTKFTMGGNPTMGTTASDTDGDLFPDDEDSCVSEPETYNGNEDYDGCPDSTVISRPESTGGSAQDEPSYNVVHVKTELSRGYVERYQADVDSKSLIVFVKIPDQESDLTITLPRYLIDSTYPDGTDQQFVVLVDGRAVYFSEIGSDQEERTITVRVPEGGSEVQLIGTQVSGVQVVPEFHLGILIFASSLVAGMIMIRTNKQHVSR